MGKGRVTIPTDLDVVPQTLEMIPTIHPGRTMRGRKHIRKKSSRGIL